MGASVRRVWAAGAVALALAAGTAGCTGGDSDGGGVKAKRAAACTDGTYTWSGVRHWQKLTALGKPATFANRTDSYETDFKAVDAKVYRPTVTGTPTGVRPARVIKALGTHLKVEEPLADPTEVERPEETAFESHTGDLKGSYYAWEYLGFVDADFAYTCQGADLVRGHVHTWETVGSGFMPCTDPADGTAGRAAAGRLCPPGTRAYEAA
ncbi:hypothetical protein [Streptomyces fulvoviolaceus]|uniref:hypothetical protein n=1 Tax=Streptomyces fulvoviolaceus TaxID=285535 RepID=UPI00069421D2|nr:hypothetical protein [Streptomyces fulvoviolaceus]